MTLAGWKTRVILATSIDGKSWTISYEGALSGAVPQVVKSVGDRLFLYGYSGSLNSSADGADWQNEAPAFGNSRITDMGASLERYIALVTDGTVTNISTRDLAGKTWSTQTLVAPTILWGIAYGNNLWMAVGVGGSVYVSSDTKVWQRREIGTTANQINVRYVNGRFLVSDDAGVVRASADGVAWDLLSVPGHASGNQLATGAVWNGAAFALPRDDGVAFSPDYATWSMPMPTTLYGYGVAFGSGRFVMCGKAPSPSGDIAGIYQSTDGEHWTNVNTSPFAVACDQYRFLEHFDAGFVVNNLYSVDGLTWSALTLPSAPMKIAKIGTTYIAYGDFGVRTSPDLRFWTTVSGESYAGYPMTNLPSGQLLKFAHTNTPGIPPFYNIVTSNDGLAWGQLTAAPDWMFELDGVAAGNGLVMLAGGAGPFAQANRDSYLATTTDGLKWTIQTEGIPLEARPTNSVFGGSEWVASGLYGTILRSANAVTWVSESAGTGKWFYHGAYGNGRVVMTTSDGAIAVK